VDLHSRATWPSPSTFNPSILDLTLSLILALTLPILILILILDPADASHGPSFPSFVNTPYGGGFSPKPWACQPPQSSFSRVRGHVYPHTCPSFNLSGLGLASARPLGSYRVVFTTISSGRRDSLAGGISKLPDGVCPAVLHILDWHGSMSASALVCDLAVAAVLHGPGSIFHNVRSQKSRMATGQTDEAMNYLQLIRKPNAYVIERGYISDALSIDWRYLPTSTICLKSCPRDSPVTLYGDSRWLFPSVT
jgi:hypothetical protein